MSINNKDPYSSDPESGKEQDQGFSSFPGGMDFSQSRAAEEAMFEAMRRNARMGRGANPYSEQTEQAETGASSAPEAAESNADQAAACAAEIEELRAKLKEAEDARLRALAEADNARRRMAREKEEFLKYAASNVLGDILPSMDNLELALEHARGQAACKDFVIGVEMTRKLLMDALKKHGLVQVGVVGEPFDPNLHEAVGMEPNPDVPDGSVSKLMSAGYKLHDRLLRPARVVVSKN